MPDRDKALYQLQAMLHKTSLAVTWTKTGKVSTLKNGLDMLHVDKEELKALLDQIYTEPKERT